MDEIFRYFLTLGAIGAIAIFMWLLFVAAECDKESRNYERDRENRRWKKDGGIK